MGGAKPKRRKKKAARERKTVKGPRDESKAREAVKLWLEHGNFEMVARLLPMPIKTLRRWSYSPFWWEMVRAESRTEYFQQMIAKASRTVMKQINDPERPEAFKLLERVEEAFLPPKQRLEITAGYMPRDAVLDAFRRLAELCATLLDDKDKRERLVEGARAIMDEIEQEGGN